MKIPFKIETVFNKIFKPQIVTIVETFINDKLQRKFYGKSLTANFLQTLYNQLGDSSGNFAIPGSYPAQNTIGKRIDGTNINGAAVFAYEGLIGDVSKGIVVGSGNVVPTPGDFTLTLIGQGVGANQLQYQIQTAPIGTTITGANTAFTLQRLMINASGGDVTVNEIGIYCISTGTYLHYRDVLSSSDVIPNLSTYRVNITFQITT